MCNRWVTTATVSWCRSLTAGFTADFSEYAAAGDKDLIGEERVGLRDGASDDERADFRGRDCDRAFAFGGIVRSVDEHYLDRSSEIVESFRECAANDLPLARNFAARRG